MTVRSVNPNKENCLSLSISGDITWKSVQNIMFIKTDELENFVASIEISSPPSPIDVTIDLTKVKKVDMCALAFILEMFATF